MNPRFILFTVALSFVCPAQLSAKGQTGESSSKQDFERLWHQRRILEYTISEANRRNRSLYKDSKLSRQRLRELYKLSRGGLLRSLWQKEKGLFFAASPVSRLLRKELEALQHRQRRLEEERGRQQRLTNHWLTLGDRLADSRLHDAVPAPLFKNRALNKALPPVGKKANYAFAKTKLKDRRTVVSRRGITLLFNSSEAIRATLDGKVSFVGKLPGLEEAVIIEHSAGLRSVYALLRAIPLKVGQQIVAGDLVGFAAIDPLRKRFALYFELREGIELVDARPLLRARGRP